MLLFTKRVAALRGTSLASGGVLPGQPAAGVPVSSLLRQCAWPPALSWLWGIVMMVS